MLDFKVNTAQSTNNKKESAMFIHIFAANGNKIPLSIFFSSEDNGKIKMN
jgi:hypothetical protein